MPLELKEHPVVWALLFEQLPNYCSFCLEPNKNDQNENHGGKKLLRCGKCKLMHYCDAQCQKLDWFQHKSECKRLVKNLHIVGQDSHSEPAEFDDGLRLVVRLYDIHTDANRCREILYDESLPRNFDQLISHEDRIDEDEFLKFYANFKRFYHKIATKSGDDITDNHRIRIPDKTIDKKLVLKIYGKVNINAFGIKSHMLQSIGIGLYMNLCRLDHSCRPNARIVFQGREAIVVATSGDDDISKCSSYDEICHSYIDNLLPKWERKRLLMKNYFFDCHCPLGCQNDQYNAQMESVTCENPDCSGFVPYSGKNVKNFHTLKCLECNSSIADVATTKMVVELTNQVVDNLTNRFAALEHHKRLEICAKTASLQMNTLYKYDVTRLKVLRWAYNSCVALNQWADAGEYGLQMFHIYDHYMTSRDPYLTVFVKNLCATLINAKMLEEARKLMDRFRPSLTESLTFDPRLMSSVEKMLQLLTI